ncbi:MAG: hypothetical protein PHT89_06335 [Lachnospiraceae bacterium]|nr:hypothetical protein [Lachnospiraceae bacterium]MDD3660329.1 hypothetical protein [Lachnospiraceae bacterium]
MGINLNLDYSTLFSSLSSSTKSSGSSSFSLNLADYASIKNGSYQKLTKAYYAKNDSDDNSSKTESSKSINTVLSDSDALKETADRLIDKGTDSLFSKKNVTTTNEDGSKTTTYGYDTDAIYKAVSAFAEDYNAMLDSSSKSTDKGVLLQASNMTTYTSSHSALLAEAGITIGSDNKLTVDEETFKKADMSTIKTLFHDSNSLAYNVSARASQINYYAQRQLTDNSTYTSSGSYSGTGNSGSLYDSYL